MAADETSGTRPAPVVLRIKLRYDDVDAMVQRFATNVGKSGIFLPTKSIQPIGSEIKFELRLADDTVVIVGLGRVRAARPPDPEDPRAVFGIAVELLRVTRESRALILRMLERRRELGLGDLAIPMPEDVDAARRGDVDTSVKQAVPQSIPAETASGGEASLLTAARRSSGPMAVAKDYAIQPLGPEPVKRPRPRVSELIAKTRSGPVAVALPELEEAVDVASAIVRAKALASGDLDKELESILDQHAAPVEIGVDAASAELARQLGGRPVPRRERSAPPVSQDRVVRSPDRSAPVSQDRVVRSPDRSARWAPPPSVTPEATLDGDAVVVSAPLEVSQPVVEAAIEAPLEVPVVAEAPLDAPVAEAAVQTPVEVAEARVEAPVAARSVHGPGVPESTFDAEVSGAVEAMVSNRASSEPSQRRSEPKLPPRLASEPRLLAGAENAIEAALSQLRAPTVDPVPAEPVRETDPFARVDDDPIVTEPSTALEQAPPHRETLDRIVDELEMDEADRTNVGAMVPDPDAFDQHAYATEPAVHDDTAGGATPPPDDEEFEIEEISDFEIIAEADEEDADLLAADGERDAGRVAPDLVPDEVSDFSIPFRPSQDFAARLALDDDDDEYAPRHAAISEQSSRHLNAFDRSDVHEIGVGVGGDSSGFDDPISYIGESPQEKHPYDPISQSYSETAEPPAEDSLEFDAPHSFAGSYGSQRPRTSDRELESALKDLEPDLNELAPPYAGAGEVVAHRTRSPAPQPVADEPSAPRRHPRATTEDGILIDFDDEDG